MANDMVLERWLMRSCGVGYAVARKAAEAARKNTGRDRKSPISDVLKEECKRIIETGDFAVKAPASSLESESKPKSYSLTGKGAGFQAFKNAAQTVNAAQVAAQVSKATSGMNDCSVSCSATDFSDSSNSLHSDEHSSSTSQPLTTPPSNKDDVIKTPAAPSSSPSKSPNKASAVISLFESKVSDARKRFQQPQYRKVVETKSARNLRIGNGASGVLGGDESTTSGSSSSHPFKFGAATRKGSTPNFENPSGLDSDTSTSRPAAPFGKAGLRKFGGAKRCHSSDGLEAVVTAPTRPPAPKVSAPPPKPKSVYVGPDPTPSAAARKLMLLEGFTFSTGTFSDLYDEGKELGEGAYAVVCEATHKKTKEALAVKIIDAGGLCKSEQELIKDEIALMKELQDHPNVVKMTEAFHERPYFYIVMEQMKGGELFDRIVAKTSYSELEARNVCVSFFSAMHYCHERRIAHRDLKPENLLLGSETDDSLIKVADWGLAKKIKDPYSLMTKIGSPGYVAPEVLDEDKTGYDVCCDMWSLGCLMFILLGGYGPFDDFDDYEMERKVRECEYEFKDEYWCNVSEDAKELIKSLLTLDYKKRPTADDVLRSKWLTKSEEVLSGQDLGKNLVAIRRFNGKRKLKAVVKTVMAGNKMKALMDMNASSH